MTFGGSPSCWARVLLRTMLVLLAFGFGGAVLAISAGSDVEGVRAKVGAVIVVVAIALAFLVTPAAFVVSIMAAYRAFRDERARGLPMDPAGYPRRLLSFALRELKGRDAKTSEGNVVPGERVPGEAGNNATSRSSETGGDGRSRIHSE